MRPLRVPPNQAVVKPAGARYNDLLPVSVRDAPAWKPAVQDTDEQHR